MQIFEERGKPEYVPGEKPLRAEKRTIKYNPHMTPSVEIEPGPHWWGGEFSHHYATTALQSLSQMVEKTLYLEERNVFLSVV